MVNRYLRLLLFILIATSSFNQLLWASEDLDTTIEPGSFYVPEYVNKEEAGLLSNIRYFIDIKDFGKAEVFFDTVENETAKVHTPFFMNAIKYLKGDFYLARSLDEQDRDLAIEWYLDAVITDNGSLNYFRALYNTALLYSREGSTYEELGTLNRIIVDKPTEENKYYYFKAAFRLGMLYEDGGKYKEARQTYLFILRRSLELSKGNRTTDPIFIQARYAMAFVALKELGCRIGDMELKEVIEQWPTYLSSRSDAIDMVLGCLMSLGRDKVLLAILQSYILTHPEDTEKNLQYIKLSGDFLWHMKEYEDAYNMYEVLSLFTPRSTYSFSSEIAIARMNIERSGESVTAGNKLVKDAFLRYIWVLKSSPYVENKAEALYAMADLAHQTGDYINYLELLDYISRNFFLSRVAEQAIAEKPAAFIFVISNLKGVDDELIVQYYMRFKDELMNKIDVKSLIVLADLLRERDFLPMSIELYTSIVQKGGFSDREGVTYRFGDSLYQNGDYSEAILVLGKHIRNFPGGKYYASALSNLGNAFYFEKKFTKAIFYYEKLFSLISEKDRDVFSLFRYAYALGVLDRTKDSAKVYKRLLSDVRLNGNGKKDIRREIYMNLLSELYSEKQCSSYIINFQSYKEEESEKTAPIVYLREARCYAMLGREEDAKAILKNIGDNDPKMKRLAKETIGMMELLEDLSIVR